MKTLPRLRASALLFLLIAASASPGCSPPGAVEGKAAPEPQLAREEDKFSPKAAEDEAARRDRINAELRKLPDHAWAGTYSFGDGLGVNVSLTLCPTSGFVFNWHGCLGLYDRNYGDVTRKGETLALGFTHPNVRKGFQGLAPELIPVAWGERRYLIPADEIAKFCNAINSGDEPRIEGHGNFLLRAKDWQKKVEGKPDLPKDYRDWLLAKPLTAKVTAIGEKSVREGVAKTMFRTSKVTLDVGKAHGVFVGIEFHFLDDSLNSARVTQVGDRESVAEVVEVLSDRGDDHPPQVGAPLSTRPSWR